MEAGHSRVLLSIPAADCFGAYECTLVPSDVLERRDRPAIAFSRELFSREWVVRSVSSRLAARSASHSRIACGHVLESVDGAAVRGLASHQLDALWLTPDSDGSTEDHVDGRAPPSPPAAAPPPLSPPQRRRRVRLRDRTRAELAVEMHKQRSHFLRVHPLLPGRGCDDGRQDDELSAQLGEAHERVWRLELDAAHAQLRALPCAADPRADVLALELEVARATASHDALEVKKARATAAQTVAWLERLAEASSLSPSCRLRAKAALAEALLLRVLVEALASANALLAAAGKVAVIATSVRRGAALYRELQRELRAQRELRGSLQDDRWLNEVVARELEARVRVGVATLRLCGALAWSSSAPLEWLRNALLPAFDGDDGRVRADPCDALRLSLRELLACVRTASDADSRGGHWSRRREWAELLLLLVGPSAVDAMAVGSSATRGDDAPPCYADRKARVLAVAACRRDLQALRARVGSEAPRWPLLLWAAGAVERAASCLPSSERAHVLRFDAGRACFDRHEFEAAARQLEGVAKCSSAPSRLRGLASVFLAAGYLATAPLELVEGAPGRSDALQTLVRSVRVLLRCAARCLAAAEGEEGAGMAAGSSLVDSEAGCLRRRLGVFLQRDDASLLLLPVEVLYVLGYRFDGGIGWSWSATASASPRARGAADVSPERHARMLRYLDAVARRRRRLAASPLDSDSREALDDAETSAEWMLLRAVVLFNLRGGRSIGAEDAEDAEAAGSQLEQLREFLVARDEEDQAGVERVRRRSFVAPVAVFYALQLRLLDRFCTHAHSSAAAYTDKERPAGASCGEEDARWRWWWRWSEEGQRGEHAYALLYDGKVRALRRLLATRTSSSSLGSCDSTGSDGSAP